MLWNATEIAFLCAARSKVAFQKQFDIQATNLELTIVNWGKFHISSKQICICLTYSVYSLHEVWKR